MGSAASPRSPASAAAREGEWEAPAADDAEALAVHRLVLARLKKMAGTAPPAPALQPAVTAQPAYCSLSAAPTSRPRRRPADCRPPPTRPEEPRLNASQRRLLALLGRRLRDGAQVFKEENERALAKLEAIANDFEAAGDFYHAAAARELRDRLAMM